MSLWLSIAIVRNAVTFSAETEDGYLVTNSVTDRATAEGIVTTDSQHKHPHNFGGCYIFYRLVRG